MVKEKYSGIYELKLIPIEMILLLDLLNELLFQDEKRDNNYVGGFSNLWKKTVKNSISC